MQPAGEADSGRSASCTPRILAESLSSADERRSREDGTNTPPSASDSGESTKNGGRVDTPKEIAIFLTNLNNYLALGCLVFEDYVIDHEETGPSCEPEWEDASHTSPYIVFDTKLSSNLSKLIAAGWIRVQIRKCQIAERFFRIYRIYVLPGDAGQRFVDRQNRRLGTLLEELIPELDIRPETWRGSPMPGAEVRFDVWATSDPGSLFWLFNKLPSPSPDVSLIERGYTREALEDLLKSEYQVPGLKADLYPYQRRSAGLMLQRESVPMLELDPRIEQRVAPDGSVFYYGSRDQLFLRNARYYETCRGGILAETMGLGKTLICLALILATRHHLPRIPAPYSIPATRSKTASLADMCVSTINRRSIPWQVEFERIKSATKDEMIGCVARLENNPPSYEVPVEPVRWNRKTVLPPPKKITLAATSIIVVPRNLCKQWDNEIRKHVDSGGLNILVMEDLRKPLPSPEEIRSFDVVLFSRNRFELEIKDGADSNGRRLENSNLLCRCPYIGATRIRDCHCLKVDDLYESPLKHLHFKRLIIDEGHFFSAANTTAVAVANKLITADHRWVVSGTPAKDLLGIEVDMSTAQKTLHKLDPKESRDDALDQRKHFNVKDDTAGAAKSLGSLASNFLRIPPWAASDGERPVNWEDYIYRHEGHRRKTFTGFSTCLRRTIESMVIKTQPQDVERDIALPPLTHEVIRLEPSYYDKLTANLFTLVLTANAVTSERTDTDYLFHRNSAKARYQLIANLRQSAFFWTGFSEEDVIASKNNSTGYLERSDTRCTNEDRSLLTEALATADAILASDGWKGLSQSHELGLFVQGWPASSANFWSFVNDDGPLMTGISQLLEAQKHVHERVGSVDPGDGLAGVGIKSLRQAREARDLDARSRNSNSVLAKSGIPSSSIDGEPPLKRQTSTPVRTRKPATSIKQSLRVTKSGFPQKQADASKTAAGAVSATLMSVQPGPPTDTPDTAEIQDHSPYASTLVIGSASSKMSYLISQILKYYKDEKILVFYDGDNAAYYLMQMLELLHVKHETYAKSLPAAKKSEYVVRFNEEPEERVLLMDVKQAAYGLNLSSASRVFFLNPVYRPNIEAQAIKRAHRIGQTRKVHVETLLLKGTIEEKMYERAKRMSRAEHQEVSHLEDDKGMRDIIQSARILPIAEEESQGAGQMAPFETPQRLWGREGWKEALAAHSKLPGLKRKQQEITSQDGSECSEPRSVKRQKKVAWTKTYLSMQQPATSGVDASSVVRDDSPRSACPGAGEPSEDDVPIIRRWRRLSQSRGTEAHVPGMRYPGRGPWLSEAEAPPAVNEGALDSARSVAAFDTEAGLPSQFLGEGDGERGTMEVNDMIPQEMSIASLRNGVEGYTGFGTL